MTKSIVVTGATGTIGTRVVEGLHAKGAPVVALVRNADKAAPFAARGVATAIGTFEDRGSLERAFAGADTVVLITAANARAGEQALEALGAAKAAGVRKIVRVSAIKASVDGPTDNTRQHGRTEAAIVASGLTYVTLRPSYFFQNLLASLPTIQQQGVMYGGVGDGKIAVIDTRDVADAAVVAATSEAFDNQTLELSGPASIDHHEIAAALSRGLGREVKYVAVPPEAVGEAMRAMGLDEWTAGIVRDYARAYSQGFGDFTTGHVAALTGHPPRSVDDFVREVVAGAGSQQG